MKITEGLGELRLLKKRIISNARQIEEYSSHGSNEVPRVRSRSSDDQIKVIRELEQSSKDLVERYNQIHTNITFTNLVTVVDMDTKALGSGHNKFSINDLLNLRRSLCKLMISVYESMNDNTYERRARSFREPGETITRYYDIEHKEQMLREWEDLYERINNRLQVVNATTDILIVPNMDDGFEIF